LGNPVDLSAKECHLIRRKELMVFPIVAGKRFNLLREYGSRTEIIKGANHEE